MYEQSNSERGKGGRIMDPRVFNKIRNISISSEESNREAAIRKAALHEEIGNDRDAIMEGSNDRFNGEEYNNPYEEGTDKYKSYVYGYNVHGQRRVDALGTQKPKSR